MRSKLISILVVFLLLSSVGYAGTFDAGTTAAAAPTPAADSGAVSRPLFDGHGEKYHAKQIFKIYKPIFLFPDGAPSSPTDDQILTAYDAKVKGQTLEKLNAANAFAGADSQKVQPFEGGGVKLPNGVVLRTGENNEQVSFNTNNNQLTILDSGGNEVLKDFPAEGVPVVSAKNQFRYPDGTIVDSDAKNVRFSGSGGVSGSIPITGYKNLRTGGMSHDNIKDAMLSASEMGILDDLSEGNFDGSADVFVFENTVDDVTRKFTHSINDGSSRLRTTHGAASNMVVTEWVRSKNGNNLIVETIGAGSTATSTVRINNQKVSVNLAMALMGDPSSVAFLGTRATNARVDNAAGLMRGLEELNIAPENIDPGTAAARSDVLQITPNSVVLSDTKGIVAVSNGVHAALDQDGVTVLAPLLENHGGDTDKDASLLVRAKRLADASGRTFEAGNDDVVGAFSNAKRTELTIVFDPEENRLFFGADEGIATSRGPAGRETIFIAEGSNVMGKADSLFNGDDHFNNGHLDTLNLQSFAQKVKNGDVNFDAALEITPDPTIDGKFTVRQLLNDDAIGSSDSVHRIEFVTERDPQTDDVATSFSQIVTQFTNSNTRMTRSSSNQLSFEGADAISLLGTGQFANPDVLRTAIDERRAQGSLDDDEVALLNEIEDQLDEQEDAIQHTEEVAFSVGARNGLPPKTYTLGEAALFAFSRYKPYNQISNLLFGDLYLDEWRESVDQFFAENYLGIDYVTSEICQYEFDQVGDNVALIETPNGIFQFVGHVEGQRSGPVPAVCDENDECNEGECRAFDKVCVDENGDELEEFFYKITYGVAAPVDDALTPEVDEEGAISFNLRVSGSGRTGSLFNGFIELENGDSINDVIVDYKSDAYTEVCIDFGKKPVGRANKEIDSICNSFSQSEGKVAANGASAVRPSVGSSGGFCDACW